MSQIRRGETERAKYWSGLLGVLPFTGLKAEVRGWVDCGSMR